jgi:ubiquinone/menaquinone biosynthesis C-methylase UbiE
MYAQSARYYDALYASMGKDYAAEADRIAQLVEQHARSGGSALLDVGCGSGRHIEVLRDRFGCEGLDVSRSMLEIASARNPGVPFHLGDMIGFNLDKRFDAIVCMFGAIAYTPNVQRLEQTLQTFVRHLKPGGVVIVEPWVHPDDWRDGAPHALFVDEPDLKIARMSVSRRDGKVSVLNFHYMVASGEGIRTLTEPHRLTLFTPEEYRAAFARAGLQASFEEPNFWPRGLWVGTRGTPGDR